MFKPKNKDITALRNNLQQEIRRLDLIDTYDMIESVRIRLVVNQNNSLTIFIQAMEYYRYLDSMSDTFPSTQASGRRRQAQTPSFPITRNWLKNSNTQKAFESISKDYTEWLLETYPILDAVKFVEDNPILIDFEPYKF
jgi:hypothetical protein